MLFRSGILYWGDVGPDAGGFDQKHGPGGFDAVMQAKKSGFFGWPYSRGDNKPYARIDFDARARYTRERAEYDKAKSAYDKSVKEAKAKNEPPPPAFALQPPVSYTAGAQRSGVQRAVAFITSIVAWFWCG